MARRTDSERIDMNKLSKTAIVSTDTNGKPIMIHPQNADSLPNLNQEHDLKAKIEKPMRLTTISSHASFNPKIDNITTRL